MKTSSASPVRVAALCAALVLAWWTLTVSLNYGGNWTALFCTGAQFQVPNDLPGTYVFPNSSGYDGQFYRYIAHDPLLHRYQPYIDNPRLRHWRILVPVLAFVLAAGNQPFIDYTYVAIVLASVAAGVYWCAAFARLHNRSTLWGSAFLLMPATLTSIDRMLVDATLCALTAGFAFYAAREDSRRLWIVLLLACLTRETGILLAAAVFLHHVWQRRIRMAMIMGSAALPMVAWTVWIRGDGSMSSSTNLFSRPIYGVIMRLFTIVPYPGPALVRITMESLSTIATLGYLLALLLMLWLFWKGPRGAVEVAGLLFALLAFALSSPDYMLDPFGYSRPISPLLLILFFRFLSGRIWIALVPTLLMSPHILMYFAHQLLTMFHLLPRGENRLQSLASRLLPREFRRPL